MHLSTVLTADKICVWRHPEGVVLNAKEYLLDDKGHPLLFDTKEQAEIFLRGHGVVPATVHVCRYGETF